MEYALYSDLGKNQIGERVPSWVLFVGTLFLFILYRIGQVLLLPSYLGSEGELAA